MSEFGFCVDHPLRQPDMWCVSLPHQCDDWDIAGGESRGVSKADAEAALKRFIVEAEAALASLQRDEVFGSEE